MDISEVRRANARALVKANGGTGVVAKRLGYKNASFVSQVLGPNPNRGMTEKMARAMEAEFKLEHGALDKPSSPMVVPPQGGVSIELMADVIRLVGTVLESEHVSLGPQKFADITALALVDALEHNGQMQEAKVRTIARLLK